MLESLNPSLSWGRRVCRLGPVFPTPLPFHPRVLENLCPSSLSILPVGSQREGFVRGTERAGSSHRREFSLRMLQHHTLTQIHTQACTCGQASTTSVGMGRTSLDRLLLMKASLDSLSSSCLSCLPPCPSFPELLGFSSCIRYHFAHITRCSSTFYAPSLISQAIGGCSPCLPLAYPPHLFLTQGPWGFGPEDLFAFSKPKTWSAAPSWMKSFPNASRPNPLLMICTCRHTITCLTFSLMSLFL